MHRIYGSKFVLILFAAVLFSMYQETPAKNSPSEKAKEPQTQTPEISYTVSMPKPWTHLLEVEMRMKLQRMPDQAELKMPVWTPGSYLVREFARHVQDFAVKDANGRALPWRKINKNTWQVDAKGAGEIVATYRVYSNE
ncbi:MAG: hypothetical protein H7070_04215, partial [Saprospiraceae bacterium]|nr:hypothetical protein [Pyrinomonadaceae bacterium]